MVKVIQDLRRVPRTGVMEGHPASATQAGVAQRLKVSQVPIPVCPEQEGAEERSAVGGKLSFCPIPYRKSKA